MRALICRQYGPPGNLVIDEWDDPTPGDDEILFDVKAAGLNFADVLMIAGTYQVKTPPPFGPGNDAAGVVTSVGCNVTRFSPGDSIIGALRGGAFAEKSVVSESAALALPTGLDFEQGATYSVAYGTSYHALKQGASLQPGETVLVLGAAGGVGYAAVDLAKAMGARVIAAASSDAKLAFAQEAGAGATAWHGRYLVVGFASGESPRLPLNLTLLKEASITGTWYGTWAERHPGEMLANAEEMAAMIESGVLRPRCTEAFVLERFADAFRVITERRALGKIALTM